MSSSPVVHPTFTLDPSQFDQLLLALTGLTDRVGSLESAVAGVEEAVEGLQVEKANRVGEITLEGVFTPAGGTGVYEAV